MTRLPKLAKLESQIIEFCSASERIAVRVTITALFFVGLWTVLKHLL
jgi:hypothetical protein